MTHRRRMLLLLALLTGCPEGIPVPALTPTVAIPGGDFTMGSAEDCPEGQNELCDPSSYAERQVRLSPFDIDRHEVTNAQYRYCAALDSCDEPVATGLPQAPDYHTDGAYDDHPVIFVNWKMADQYCRFVGRRLPSEAEWEFVARTRQDGRHENEPRAYPWGNNPPTCALALIKGCGLDLPTAVETITGDVSDWGVRDLGGNVAEWVADLYSRYAYCRDEVSLAESCNNDADCIDTSCFDGLDVRSDCVLLCSDATEKTPFCLKELSRLDDPKTRRGGPDRSIRGGDFLDGACTANSVFRRHASPESAQAWTGFRCAGGGS